MIMLIAFAGDGHERGLDEWKALADQSGWNIRKVYPITNTWVSAIELVPTEKTELSEVKAAPQEGEYDRVQTQDTTAKGKESRLTKSEMRFLVPWDLTQRGNPFIRSCPDDGFERTNLEWEPHRVCIGDARPSIRKFSLDEHGFAFFDDNESLPPDVIEAIRANRTREVESLYYPWVKKLVACKTGARVVHIFDHTVRRRYPEKDKHLNADGQEQPATIVCFTRLPYRLELTKLGSLRRVCKPPFTSFNMCILTNLAGRWELGAGFRRVLVRMWTWMPSLREEFSC